MLTKREQVQALANMLAGQNGQLDASKFTEPWRTCYTIIQSSQLPIHALRIALDEHEDGGAILDEILRTPPEGSASPYQSLAELSDDLPPIEWLWPGWLPFGMLSLLGGEPGAGKSFLALDMARRIIAGEEFPDGAPAPRDRHVIYVDAENVPQLLNERATIWGMDKALLFPLLPDSDRGMIDLRDNRDRESLIRMCKILYPSLVIIDSLSTVHSKGENSIEDVRDVLSFLNNLAGENNTAVLLIHHLRKRGLLAATEPISIHDFRGSSHIIAMARSVLAMSIVQDSPDLDRNGPRRLEVIKTNLARHPPALGINLRPLEPDGVWLDYGEPPKTYEPVPKLELCSEWILKLLGDSEEPIKVKDIVAQAVEKGFSRSTLFRARKLLGALVTDSEGVKSPNNAWLLPGEQDY